MHDQWYAVLRQYDHEINRWTRLLEFFTRESVFMKDRIGDVLNAGPAPEAVRWLENFQKEWQAWERTHSQLVKDLHAQKLRRSKCAYPARELQQHQEYLRVHVSLQQDLFYQLKNSMGRWMSRHFFPPLAAGEKYDLV